MDWSTLKAFTDDKIRSFKIWNLFWWKVENVALKGENAGYQHFLLFPQCLQKRQRGQYLRVCNIDSFTFLSMKDDGKLT